MGIVLATVGAVRQEISNGSLVQVLPDWDMGSVDMHAVFTAGRAAKPYGPGVRRLSIGSFA